MSNNSVGTVYQAIIQDVIDSSRVDFEEGGVEEGVLEELKQGWQRKLTQLGVASFPWDPKPQEPPPQANNSAPAAAVTAVNAAAAAAVAAPAVSPTPPAPTQYTQATLSPPSNGLSLPGGGPQVKTEPGTQNEPLIKQEHGVQNMQMPPRQAYPQGSAKERAAEQLGNRFGIRAQASIDALQGNVKPGQPMTTPTQPPQMPQMPMSVPQPQQASTQEQYRQAMATQTALQQQQQQQHGQQNHPAPGLGQSQTDGPAAESEGVLVHRDSDGNLVELGRVDIDVMLHERIAANAKRMEGGGLMVPLKAAARHNVHPVQKSKHASGFDGPDDEEDEDAINSDLDDPEDELEEDDDDDDGMGHTMLCMYDKVQRVKNKWKCTLKDGVLTVNGRDYVFHKATGEYEW